MLGDHLHSQIGQYGILTDPKTRILLIRRKRSGQYCLPGGRIHETENWRESLYREIYEEVGVSVSGDARPVGVALIRNEFQIKYCVVFHIPLVTSDALQSPSEHTQLDWVEAKQIQHLEFENRDIQNIIISFAAPSV